MGVRLRALVSKSSFYHPMRFFGNLIFTNFAQIFCGNHLSNHLNEYIIIIILEKVISQYRIIFRKENTLLSVSFS